MTVEDSTAAVDYPDDSVILENDVVRRRRRRQDYYYDDDDNNDDDDDERRKRQLSQVMANIRDGASKVERNQYDVKKIANQIDPGKLLMDDSFALVSQMIIQAF